MKSSFFRWMIAMFILSLFLLVFAPKALAWVAVVVSMIPLLVLLVGTVIFCWYTWMNDQPLKNPDQ